MAPVVSAPKPVAPVAPAPVAAPAAVGAPVLDSAKLKTTMLEVVAEKTGYPTDMLELEMDMEADLGIDSIKRVEILGAVQEAHPGLPELNPEVMSELRTLGEIVDYMNSQLLEADPVASAAPVATAPAAAGINPEQIMTTMLEVVAEKTGYPTDMLE